MNKEILLSTILLANPVMSMGAQRVSEVKDLKAKVDRKLLDSEFISVPIEMDEWKYDEAGNYFKERVMKKVSLAFVKRTTLPTIWSMETGIEDFYADYEVVVTLKKHSENSEDSGVDEFYYAKKSGKNRYKIYDCQSTSSCQRDVVIDVEIVESSKGKILRVISSDLTNYNEEALFAMLMKNPILLETNDK
ncbi:hypothetical protein [Bacteriovorax sp. BSW11_IV]|uniref:hypothetical protein n=1 Tax=Bacteriovorax sp. BSW11_IV TaxID=1353529 RepID=UPI0004213484|nr:hypothetical protein [Bacteriovorax sp. BSW11_IV]